MFKHFLLIITVLFSAISAVGQGTITFTTSADVGTEISLVPKPKTSTSTITIDWGNGVEQKYTVNPSGGTSSRRITAPVQGQTITIKANLTELLFNNASLTSAEIQGMASLTKLDLANNEIETFKLLDTTPLKELILTNNKLTNSPSQGATLSLENCGTTLTKLTVNDNDGLTCLDMRNLSALTTLTVKNCKSFTSLFICSPEEKQESLTSIYISNCALSHFYPVSLPKLTTLELSNNLLATSNDQSPFELGDYPKLSKLDISGNKGIDKLNISKCTGLTQLFVYDCSLSTIDVSQNTALTNINCSGNNIKSLDLGNNTALTVLTVNNNPISEIDIKPLTKLSTLNISNTDIAFVDLMDAFYLTSFKAASSKLSFVDFHGQQPSKMTVVDLRDCPNFTSESMDYTLHTLPEAKKTSSTNLWIAGSNAEHSNTAYVASNDLRWICDIEGDGTAENNLLDVTLDGAVDTGTNKTGTVDRLFPNKGYSLDYDLDVMKTDGGEFIICQWVTPEGNYFDIASVNNSAYNGVPICIYAYPEEGRTFKSVTVNGKEIESRWFFISEPSTIKVNFTSEKQSVSFDVTTGQEMSFLVNTTSSDGTVEVDWGTGNLTPYTGQQMYSYGTIQIGGTRIKGTAAGPKVTIYGDIAAIDVSGYGDMASTFGVWDNHITAVDLTNCPDLKLFNAHWNPISEIDLSKNTSLEILDLSYCKLSSIDLSANTNLLYVAAYSDGFGTGDIAMLNSIEVSNLSKLQILNLKNNKLTALDLSGNPALASLNLNGNLLAALDLSNNKALQSLDVSRNKLSALDLSANTALTELAADNNEIANIDLSKNTKLKTVYLGNNKIKELDLSPLSGLQRVSITGNGLSADQLNDIYYKLPQRVDDGSDNSSVNYNLLVYQSGDKEANDATGADSSIAEDRAWTPSHMGSNGGSDFAYLDIIDPANGTITVTDSKGNTYAHGSKVPKYEVLTITPNPEKGYVFKSYTLNNEDPVASTTFEMPGVYTKLGTTFALQTGVDNITTANWSITAVPGGIEVSATKALAEVYSASGILMQRAEVEGTKVFDVATGFYIVRISSNGNTKAQSVIVK